jgi:hypothetical protein
MPPGIFARKKFAGSAGNVDFGQKGSGSRNNNIGAAHHVVAESPVREFGQFATGFQSLIIEWA